MANRVTGKLGSIVAGANVDIADVIRQVIQPMRNGDPGGQTGPVVVKHLNGFLSIESALAVQLANQFSFFVSILITGLPAA
jgi:hypothetical protein